MSEAASRKGGAGRVAQFGALLLAFAVLYVVNHTAPVAHASADLIASIGFLLFAGMLTSELLELVGLPHLTGYLLTGVIAGPHVLHLIDHEVVRRLEVVNVFALALIALAGGIELRLDVLKSTRRSLAWTTFTQSTLVLLVMAIVFTLLSRYLPFLAGFKLTEIIGIGLLWGVISVSRSPSACLGILAQTKAEGPIARFSLAFVMSSDVVVILLLAAALTLVRPFFGHSEVSMDELWALGHEVLGSVSFGTTLALVLALYIKVVRGQLLLVLLALGFGLTEGIHYLHFDPLLTFLIAGFVIQNFTNQGPPLLHAIERTGSIVFIVFFATAGAHLNIPLLASLWPVALALCGARALSTVVAHRLGARIAQDEPRVRRWGWASLISQAGLTLGLSAVVERTFPSFGSGFRALAIAAVALNELIGPILFKLALDRTGESKTNGAT
jgi:Kef-type K+ transport system membrane component KefB